MRGKPWSSWRRHNYEFFKKYLVDTAGKTVVDLGAGDFLFPGLFENADYKGVDISSSPLVSVIADINKPLPFEGCFADIIYASNTIEHIHNPQNFFRESFRILKPGGMIIGTVPFLRPLHCEPADYLRYTPFMLNKLLADAGFIKVEVESLGSVNDMYRLSRDIFFTEVLSKAEGWRFVIFRLMRKLYKWFDLALPEGHCSPSYTEGYGFKAFRP